jgi:peptidoglycan/LPS O-acetylase OafA/YrhL
MTIQNKNVISPNTGYMIQLDSLRAIAVIIVMLSHFIPDNTNYFGRFLLSIDDFLPGVPLFFVLSGFLITGILLRCRDK